MPNLHKAARNAEIARLFDGGRGLTHREIAERMGMKTSAVSMAIKRWHDKLREESIQSNQSNQSKSIGREPSTRFSLHALSKSAILPASRQSGVEDDR